MTNAFDRLGTICLIFTALLVLPFLYVVRGAFMMVALFAIAAFPLCWIAGLNSLEFLTRPFNEKGVKGGLDHYNCSCHYRIRFPWWLPLLYYEAPASDVIIGMHQYLIRHKAIPQ